MSLPVRIEEGDLDLNLDQVNHGEKCKTSTGGCEDYVPARRKAAVELCKNGAKRDDYWTV